MPRFDRVAGWMRRPLLPFVVLGAAGFLVLSFSGLFIAIAVVLIAHGHRILGGVLLGLGLTVAIGVLILHARYESYRVPSASMEPTLQVGDRYLARDNGQARVGDVAVFHPPAGAADNSCGVVPRRGEMCRRAVKGASSMVYNQRVIAAPGDRVALRNGHVIRNGQRVEEPFVTECTDSAADCHMPRTITVPPDTYMMLGDNRGGSDDSRFWGPVPERNIIGHVAFRYWPLDRIGDVE